MDPADQTGQISVFVYITAAADEEPMPVESSIQRELLFLQSHTIHHMALIQLLCERLGFTTDPEFAFSPSTLKFGESHD